MSRPEETTHEKNVAQTDIEKGFWASNDGSDDSDKTDFSISKAQIQRSESQQSSSVSFRSDSDSEQDVVTQQSSSVSFRSDSESEQDIVSKKHLKTFQVLLKTSEGNLGISVKASNVQMFIKNIKMKFHEKCQNKNIDCLLLEIDKENISLKEDTLEFDFLKSFKMTVIKVVSSPIKDKVTPVEHVVTSAAEVKDLGMYIHR